VGVIYIATGQRYADEAARSLASLRRHEPDLPVTLFTDVRQEHPGFTSVVYVEDRRNHPRKVFHAKVACMGQSPYDRTLFLDTDTHVCGTVREVFDLLDRFEFAGALAPKRIPGVRAGLPQVLPGTFAQLNSGVLLFRRCERVERMLADWLRRYDAHDFPNFFGDQHELREALWASDLQLGILPTEWNCRLPWAFAVQEPVKILHGRHRCIDLVERRVNDRPNRVRAFTPVDFRPEALREWAAQPASTDARERACGPRARARVRQPARISASIFVVGPEGSGTTLLWRCIAAHPELRDLRARAAPHSSRRFPPTGLLLHLSLPTLRPMRWVHPQELPRGARIFTVRRSPVHTVYSAYRRFFDDPREAWRAYFQAVRLESSYMAAPGAISVAYEALVQDPAAVLRGLYGSLGVREDFLPSVRLRDRNDDRWRADARFAEFMSGAFGELADLGPLAGAPAAPPQRRSVTRARARVPESPPAAEPTSPPARIVAARFVRIDDLLAPAEHARLLRYARTRERDFAASTVISPDRVFRMDPEFRRSGTLHELEDVWEMFDARLRRLLPYVRQELELTWFPLGRVERQMAVHRGGGFFSAHADNTDPAVAGRCLTCVYYFHRRPKRFSGGELWLYETVIRNGQAHRGQRHVSVVPADNTAVFFPSDVHHQVRPVRPRSDAFADSRFSVNVWFWAGEMPSLAAPSGSAEKTVGRVRARSRRTSRAKHLASVGE